MSSPLVSLSLPLLRRLLLSVLLALFTCVLLTAQTGNGSIQGVVKDPTGAVIAGAAVHAVHVQTSRAFETSTNQVGFFVFPSVQIGSYKVTVQAAGMQTWQGELLLQTSQTAALSPVLNVGGTSTEITVAGDVTKLVTEESPTVGRVLERTRIEQLPLNGRFFSTLVGVTTPGVEGLRAYGLREAALEFVQDGAVLTNRDTGGLSGRPPGIDSIEEFKVETNNSSAKMNRPATTIISTKSGTNQLHGSAFETMRNNGFGVARRRQDYYNKPPHLVRNEFGASLGGPVYLPKVYNGQNRTFFFFSYEAYRQMQSTTASTTVPTVAMRNGDFSGLIDSVGRRITLYDPWTTDANWGRQPFPNNQIPISRRSPLAKYLYSVTPEPTMLDTNPLVASNYFGTSPNNRRDYTLTTRIDHKMSERDQVFGRYSHGNRWSEYKSSSAAPTTLDKSTNVTYLPIHDESFVGSWNHTFSPTFFSETVASLSYENYDVYTGTYFQDHAGTLGLPNPFKEEGFPSIYSTGFGMNYVQADTRRNNKTWVTSIDENLTKVAGRHELQFGGRFRNERMHVLPDQQYVSGNHTFSSAATALYDPKSGSTYSAVPRTGHDAANLFLGAAASYSAQFVQKMYRFRDREFAGYLQDNFRVNSRLTLNLGLRYEYHPALHEQDNLFTGFDRASKSIVNGLPLDQLYKLGRTTPQIVSNFTRIGVSFKTPQEVGLPDGLIYANRLDFGPRAGFAYKVTSGRRSTVLRGGYALYSYPTPLRNFDASTRTNPPFNANFVTSYTSAAQSPDGLPNYALRSVPTVVAGVNSSNVIDPTKPGGVNRGGFSIAYFDPNQPSTRVHEYNLTLEREVMDNTVARVGFVGNHGYNLEQFYRYNQAPNNYIWFVTQGTALPTGEYSGVARRGFDQTTYGDIMMYEKTGWSNYNGIQLELERRYSKGYGFQIFYVMANAFRVAGNGWRDDIIQDTNMFLPNAVPSDVSDRNRFMNYRRDTDMPKHRFRWNWLVDLPFGQGKPLGRNAGRFMNALIGGWQVAGYGSIRSNYWSLPTGNWGEMGKVEVYGTKYKIEDCRSGRCIPGYLYWNGYIPANRINSYGANGKPNGVMGVPDSYKPAQTPIIPIPKDGGSPSDPNYAYYDSNTVWVTLKNGTVQRTSYDSNLHPWRNQFVAGPLGFSLDASAFKTVRLTERFNLRFNADFFNVLNTPGMNQPGGNGILSLQNSAQEARQMQLTLRLAW